MVIELLRPWKGFRVGKVFSDMQIGVAEILVKRKVGRIVQDGISVQRSGVGDETVSRTTEPIRSQEATGNRGKRRQP